MDFNFLIFIAGIFVGGLFTCLYFKEEIRKRGERNLTIEAIVHELRTPLAGLNWIFNSLSELKLNDNLNEENINLIKEGGSKVGNAIGLTNDALTALNTSVDYASYKFQIGDIIEIIDKVIRENSLGVREKSINLNFKASEEVVPFSFDRIKTTLAIRNLVNNAIKYTPVGGEVDIDVCRNGNKIVISVSDTGMGIPKADIDKISDKFYRAKNAVNTSGSGLGLFIVKNIIAGHGGKMDIQSNEGKGTKITISLPIKYYKI